MDIPRTTQNYQTYLPSEYCECSGPQCIPAWAGALGLAVLCVLQVIRVRIDKALGNATRKNRVWGLRGLLVHFQRQFIKPLLPEGLYIQQTGKHCLLRSKASLRSTPRRAEKCEARAIAGATDQMCEFVSLENK